MITETLSVKGNLKIVVTDSKTKEVKETRDLKNLVQKKNLEDKITFTGGISDIENIYNLSNIVFNLSLKPEPFGRTTIEAISCGAKVVGWDHGGTKEILENLFPLGLVELANIDALKEVTIKVANNDLYPKS